jgi:hypothetical protein
MGVLVHHLLLVAAIAALLGAGFRAASTCAPSGLERLLAAAVYAAAFAVIEALALGLVNLGGSPWALSGAALLTWLAARALLPTPSLSASDELRAAARVAGPVERALVAGLFGAVLGVGAWALWHPYLGFDGVSYHLSEVVQWLQHGDPGSLRPVTVTIPVENYPITNEVTLAWGFGIAHSFVPQAIWVAALSALFVASSWLGLRLMKVPRWAAALAIAAIGLCAASLHAVVQASETDFAELAWLITAAALAAAAALRHPKLLAPALLAACLAVGSKTTAAPLALLALGLATYALRGRLRPLLKPVLYAALLGLVAGGTWYFRNLVQHGSPLWPLVQGPFGDSLPPLIRDAHYSLLQRPSATLGNSAIRAFDRDELGGTLVILVGALLAPLWAPSRTVFASAGVTVLAGLAWASAPFTGSPPASSLFQFNGSTIRYALPAVAMATLTVALGARKGKPQAWIAGGVFVLAIAYDIERYLALRFLPSDGLLVALALGGALMAVLVCELLEPRPHVLAMVGLPLVGVLLALAAPGYGKREQKTREYGSDMIGFLQRQPAWAHGKLPVAAEPTVLATVAGSKLEHPIALIRTRETCAQIRARRRAGWIVVGRPSVALHAPVHAPGCLAGVRPDFDDALFRVYRPSAPQP